MAHDYVFMGVASLATVLVRLAIHLVVLVAGLTVVKRHRPDLTVLVAGSGALGALGVVAQAAVTMVGPILVQDAMRSVVLIAAATLGFSIVSACAEIMLIVALLKAVQRKDEPFPTPGGA